MIGKNKQKGFIQIPIAGFIAGALAIVPMLYRALFQLLPAIIVYIMTFLGIAAVTYTGVDILLDVIVNNIDNQVNSLPSNIIQAIRIANFDKALTLYVSYVTFKINFNLIKSFKTKYRIVNN